MCLVNCTILRLGHLTVRDYEAGIRISKTEKSKLLPPSLANVQITPKLTFCSIYSPNYFGRSNLCLNKIFICFVRYKLSFKVETVR